MELDRLPVNETAAAVNRKLERTVNRLVRGRDKWLKRLRLGGRKATYDDERYEFLGGPSEKLRKKHYDKSLRLLWKAEEHAPWSSFRDATKAERKVLEMADEALNSAERKARERIGKAEFRALLDREYTLEQKRAIVSVLSALGHGEAYAWLVSAEVLADVESTGGKAAVTMQVLEEAKHFVVLRELIQAFGVEVPRLSVWEYVLLEQVYKADGLEKLFGMNVLIEGIALSVFGLLADMPGMEILRMFHLDESRHTALPQNYFKEYPLTRWERYSPVKRLRRLQMVLPAVPLLLYLEEDLATLGVDAFDFGGSVIRKIAQLAERAGFFLPVPADVLTGQFNVIFNVYAYLTREGHRYRDFRNADTTRDERARQAEREVLLN